MKTLINLSKIILGTSLLLCSLNSCKNEPKQENLVIESNDQTEAKLVNDDIENIDSDAAFLAYAAEINLLEVEIGRLALQKAINGDVKDYARMLIDDHNKSLLELKTLANKQTITLPNAIPEPLMEKYNGLKEKSAADFDKAFVDMMVEEHETAVDKMTAISQKIKNSDSKLWSSRQIDSFITHRDEAKKLKEKIK
jgi:putative membrane protein